MAARTATTTQAKPALTHDADARGFPSQQNLRWLDPHLYRVDVERARCGEYYLDHPSGDQERASPTR